MAVIDYTSLKNIKINSKECNLTNQELIQSSMTQPYQSDQCGAYALVAAAATFEKLPKTISLSAENLAVNEEIEVKLDESNDFHEIASKIYKLTGNLNQNLNGYVEKNGYNNPLTLIEVAKQLGLSAKMYFTSDGIVNMSKMHPDGGNYTPETFIIGENQIALSVMVTFNKTYHWIARSSDNSYFDSLRNFYPGDKYGRVGALWPSRPYIDFGLTILLTNK